MTEGSPVRHLILFAIPALIGNIFQQIYNLADSIIVGRLIGPEALAAVGSTASVTFLFFALCNGIGGGGGIVVSQYFGARDDDNVRNCIVNTGFIMLLVPVFFGSIGYITAPQLLRLLSTPEGILADAVSYIRVMCISLFFVSIYNYLSSMLRALGDSRSPLYFLILSTILNVGLDFVFVYYLGMGIRGAAVATAIAQCAAAVACGIYAHYRNPYFRFRRSDFSISGKMVFRIVRLGVPLSLQFGLIAISSMALQRVVNSFGTVVVAAFTATSRIEQFIHQPYMTLGASLSTYCGQNFGAKKNDRVLAGYRRGLLLMTIITAVMVLVMQTLGGAIAGIFVTDAEIRDLGAAGLRITSLFYITLGVIYVVRGLLTGVGDAFFALFNGIVEVIGRFTVPVLMTSFLGFGAAGIWWSSGIVWMISGVTAWLRYFIHFRGTIMHQNTGEERD